MPDVIWGHGSRVLSERSFVLNVTHRKDGNRLEYSDTEEVVMTSADLPGFPADEGGWSEGALAECVLGAFLKCEVDGRDASGSLSGRVSHSGVGGY